MDTPMGSSKRRPGRPRLGSDPTRGGKSQMLMARVPDELLEIVDQVGREQGARGRSEALRKAIELLRELKNRSVNHRFAGETLRGIEP